MKNNNKPKANMNKATLTKSEDAVYSNSFEFYLNNVRHSNERADKHAWRETVKASPRLAKFDGANP
jgi:hypothetical protein